MADNREISCRVSNTILNFVKLTRPDLIDDLIHGLPYDLDYLFNTDNWITWDEERQMEARLAELFDDPMIMYNVGRSIISNRSLGLLNLLFHLATSPEKMYRYTPKWASYFTKDLIIIRILNSTPESALVEIRAKGRQTRGACLFNQGMFAVLTTPYGLGDAQISEVQCVVHKHELGADPVPDNEIVWGAESCIFEARWSNQVIVNAPDANQSDEMTLANALKHLEDNYTKLQTAYELLSKSEVRYRDLMENARDIIMLLDNDGVITSINRMGLELTGYTLQEMIGVDFMQFLGESSSVIGTDQLPSAFPQAEGALELHMRAKDSSILILSVNATRIIDGNDVLGQMLIARDVTQEREMAGRLIEAEKFAAKGLVAAEIAHEINNSLANIETGLFIMNNMHVDEQYRQNLIGEFHEEIIRMSSIVRGILEVYSADNLVVQQIDLNQEVEKVLQFVSRRLKGKGVVMRSQLARTCPTIMCRAGHLKQALLNLLKNAEDAIAETGTKLIMVSTHDDIESEFITLRVHDTGCGVPDNLINKVGTKLFTTKRNGVGLGLSICKQLIEQNNGQLLIESKPGAGTTVSVHLRRSTDG